MLLYKRITFWSVALTGDFSTSSRWKCCAHQRTCLQSVIQNTCVKVCVVGWGVGKTSDRLRRTPPPLPPQHPHPTTHTNKAPRSARSVRASCYRHVTVEEVLSPFIFVPPKQKADPLLSSSVGRHGGGPARRAIFLSL